MRPRPRASILLCVLVAGPLVGCAEDARAPPDEGREGIVAFVDRPSEQGPNRTILALREGGLAERLTYLADGSWVPRLAPGVTYAAEDLSLLYGPAGARERGGFVLRIERGRVPQEALAALAPFLAREWPTPFLPPGEPHPWYRPVLFVRSEPYAVSEAPPDGAQHLPAEFAPLADLIDAFDAVEAAFVVETTMEAQLPYDQVWGGCLRAETSASPDAVRVGEVVEIRVNVTNCGASDVTIDPARCTDPPSVNVQVSGAPWPMLAVLPSSEEPGAAYALDLACRGDAPALEIPAGGTRTITRRWNGSIAACAQADVCEYRPATPGHYGLVAFASAQAEATPASVTLVASDARTTRLLLVRERDQVNTTGDAPIQGHFGPHCAPVGYTLEPPTVTIWYSESAPEIGEALVVRDWRGSERPGRVVTFSSDRLDLLLFQADTARLASPFDGALTLAQIRLEEDRFVVDGAPIAPGERHVVRATHDLERNGQRYQVASVLEMENVGEAAVLWARAGGCA